MPKYLTEEQVKFYRENGYVKVKPIPDEEVHRLSEDYDELFRLADAGDLDATWRGDDIKKAANHKQTTVKSLHNLQMFSARFHKFLMNENLLDALEDVMGTENIALHHTKAHIKPPESGSPYPTHQDYPYFPFKNHSMVAVFLHLDDTTEENGGLCVYPGSHKLGPLPAKRSEGDGNAYFWCDQEAFPLERAVPVRALKGEVVIFSYLLVHGSYLNVSARPRRMFLVQLMAAEDEATEETHLSPAQGLMLRGVNRKIDSEISSWRRNKTKH